MAERNKNEWRSSREDMESYIEIPDGAYHVVYLYPPDDSERIPIISDNPRGDAKRVLDAIAGARHETAREAAVFLADEGLARAAIKLIERFGLEERLEDGDA